jgi:hypothetical protein
MQIRPRISQEEFDLIKGHRALKEECEATGIPLDSVNYYWYKSEKFSINAKNKQKSYLDVRDEVIKKMQSYAPDYKTIPHQPNNEGTLLVIDPADIHIGKLSSSFETGEDYNNQIAVKRVLEGVYGILAKSQGFCTDKILLIIGNDILHVDGAKSSTTSGTTMDTDGMWYDNFLIAKKLYIQIIETLTQVADVHVQYNPSNHDYVTGFLLADSLSSWFHKCENVTFDVSISHRKYFNYHNNLIGTTHGDGAKINDLALLMAHEASDVWHTSKHRYMYYHHIHHKVSKDYMSVCVEALRSPSGTDSWHHRNGYQHAPKAIEGYIHHKEHGQIARLTHLF